MGDARAGLTVPEEPTLPDRTIGGGDTQESVLPLDPAPVSNGANAICVVRRLPFASAEPRPEPSMQPLAYHAGQLAVQNEANTRPVADKLRNWVGPVTVFANAATLVVVAALERNGAGYGDPRFSVLSGAPPLVDASMIDGDVVVTFPRLVIDAIPAGSRVSAIVIDPAAARRSRICGELARSTNGATIRASAAMTHCRKYIAPSVAEDQAMRIGPTGRAAIALDDTRIGEVLAEAETAFLATVTPDGWPVAAHRGGPAGFIRFDARTNEIAWPEFVGDGMFVNTGNLRATGRFTLLALDLVAGEAIELVGSGDFVTLRTQKEARADALLHLSESFAVQGEVRGRIERAQLLRGLFHPRRRIAARARVTSSSAVDEQAPR